MEDNIKIVIVDDHKLFREAIFFVLSDTDGIEVVGEATTGDEFLIMLDKLNVDIALMDIMMPGISIIDATKKALKKYPDLKIIILTMLSDSEFYKRLLDAGISGYILKDSGKDELLRAIWAVESGEKYLSQKFIHKIISDRKDSYQNPQNRLSLRMNKIEESILRMVCLGKTNAEISKDLSISQRAIENYKSVMINKAGVRNSLGLVIYAVKNRLVDIK